MWLKIPFRSVELMPAEVGFLPELAFVILLGFLKCKKLKFLHVTFERNELESSTTAQITGN